MVYVRLDDASRADYVETRRRRRDSKMTLANTPVSEKYPILDAGCRNRRSRVSSQYRDFSDVVALAERMLQEQDWIWSIWLFGSRARCDARLDSDWDLALITSSYRKGEALDYRLLSPPSCASVAGPIQCHQIPIHEFMEKRLARGHVAFAVAGEGIPLAQRNWLLPTHQPSEDFQMDHSTYQSYLEQFTKGIKDTGDVFNDLANPDLHDDWLFSYKDLLFGSVDLAEGIAKAGCLARDLDPELHTHNMDSLATDLRGLKADEIFVSLVQSLNGNSDRHNRARYLTSPSLRDAELACDRTCLALASAANELRAQKEIFENNGDHEALMIHEIKIRAITGSLSRLDRTLKESEPPRVAHELIPRVLRPIIPHMWSRKPELIEVTRTLKRGIDELDRGIDNGLER